MSVSQSVYREMKTLFTEDVDEDRVSADDKKIFKTAAQVSAAYFLKAKHGNEDGVKELMIRQPLVVLNSEYFNLFTIQFKNFAIECLVVKIQEEEKSFKFWVLTEGHGLVVCLFDHGKATADHNNQLLSAAIGGVSYIGAQTYNTGVQYGQNFGLLGQNWKKKSDEGAMADFRYVVRVNDRLTGSPLKNYKKIPVGYPIFKRRFFPSFLSILQNVGNGTSWSPYITATIFLGHTLSEYVQSKPEESYSIKDIQPKKLQLPHFKSNREKSANLIAAAAYTFVGMYFPLISLSLVSLVSAFRGIFSKNPDPELEEKLVEVQKDWYKHVQMTSANEPNVEDLAEREHSFTYCLCPRKPDFDNFEANEIVSQKIVYMTSDKKSVLSPLYDIFNNKDNNSQSIAQVKSNPSFRGDVSVMTQCLQQIEQSNFIAKKTEFKQQLFDILVSDYDLVTLCSAQLQSIPAKNKTLTTVLQKNLQPIANVVQNVLSNENFDKNAKTAEMVLQQSGASPRLILGLRFNPTDEMKQIFDRLAKNYNHNTTLILTNFNFILQSWMKLAYSDLQTVNKTSQKAMIPRNFVLILSNLFLTLCIRLRAIGILSILNFALIEPKSSFWVWKLDTTQASKISHENLLELNEMYSNVIDSFFGKNEKDVQQKIDKFFDNIGGDYFTEQAISPFADFYNFVRSQTSIDVELELKRFSECLSIEAEECRYLTAAYAKTVGFQSKTAGFSPNVLNLIKNLKDLGGTALEVEYTSVIGNLQRNLINDAKNGLLLQSPDSIFAFLPAFFNPPPRMIQFVQSLQQETDVIIDESGSNSNVAIANQKIYVGDLFLKSLLLYTLEKQDEDILHTHGDNLLLLTSSFQTLLIELMRRPKMVRSYGVLLYLKALSANMNVKKEKSLAARSLIYDLKMSYKSSSGSVWMQNKIDSNDILKLPTVQIWSKSSGSLEDLHNKFLLVVDDLQGEQLFQNAVAFMKEMKQNSESFKLQPENEQVTTLFRYKLIKTIYHTRQCYLYLPLQTEGIGSAIKQKIQASIGRILSSRRKVRKVKRYVSETSYLPSHFSLQLRSGNVWYANMADVVMHIENLRQTNEFRSGSTVPDPENWFVIKLRLDFQNENSSIPPMIPLCACSFRGRGDSSVYIPPCKLKIKHQKDEILRTVSLGERTPKFKVMTFEVSKFNEQYSKPKRDTHVQLLSKKITVERSFPILMKARAEIVKAYWLTNLSNETEGPSSALYVPLNGNLGEFYKLENLKSVMTVTKFNTQQKIDSFENICQETNGFYQCRTLRDNAIRVKVRVSEKALQKLENLSRKLDDYTRLSQIATMYLIRFTMKSKIKFKRTQSYVFYGDPSWHNLEPNFEEETPS